MAPPNESQLSGFMPLCNVTLIFFSWRNEIYVYPLKLGCTCGLLRPKESDRNYFVLVLELRPYEALLLYLAIDLESWDCEEAQSNMYFRIRNHDGKKKVIQPTARNNLQTFKWSHPSFFSPSWAVTELQTHKWSKIRRGTT